MRRKSLFLAALALAACGGDPAPAPTGAPIGPPPAERRLAAEVADIEIGRTFDGYAVAATGAFSGRGWSRAGLQIVDTDGPGPDGLIDLELTAQVPPRDAVPDGATRLRAHALMREAQRRGALGIRVRSAGGFVEKAFP